MSAGVADLGMLLSPVKVTVHCQGLSIKARYSPLPKCIYIVTARPRRQYVHCIAPYHCRQGQRVDRMLPHAMAAENTGRTGPQNASDVSWSCGYNSDRDHNGFHVIPAWQHYVCQAASMIASDSCLECSISAIQGASMLPTMGVSST